MSSTTQSPLPSVPLLLPLFIPAYTTTLTPDERRGVMRKSVCRVKDILRNTADRHQPTTLLGVPKEMRKHSVMHVTAHVARIFAHRGCKTSVTLQHMRNQPVVDGKL